MVRQLRRAYPGVNFYHVAHGQVMVEMKEDFDAGQLEDLDTLIGNKHEPNALFTDRDSGMRATWRSI